MLNPRRQQGLSLVELLVGVAIALVLVSGAAVIYMNSLRGSAASSALVQVNQALRGIMNVIEYDLRRAGYANSAAAGTPTNPFTARLPGGGVASTDLFVSADQRCVLYTFDLDLDGAVDTAEFFGFWYDRTTRRMMVLDQAGGSPVTDTSAISDCSGYSWQPMNFPSAVTLEDASFSTGGSQCIAYAPQAYNPSGPAGTSFVRWQLDPDQANTVAGCDTTSAGGAAVPAGRLPAGVAVTLLPTHTARAEIRQVIVSLRAAQARDTTISRTLTMSLRLRNDRQM